MPPKRKPAPADDPNANNDPDDGAEGEDLDERVNAIITKRLNRALAKFDERLSAGIEAALKPVLERFEQGKGAEGKGQEKGDGAGADKKGDPQTDARIAELEKKLAKEREQREAQAAATQRASVASALKSALGGKVRPGTLDVLVGHLMREGGPVKVGKDGAVKLVLKDDDGDAADFELDKGVERFLGTEEGKEFVPARGINGSGADPKTGKTGANAGGQTAVVDAASELNNVFRGLLG